MKNSYSLYSSIGFSNNRELIGKFPNEESAMKHVSDMEFFEEYDEHEQEIILYKNGKINMIYWDGMWSRYN